MYSAVNCKNCTRNLSWAMCWLSLSFGLQGRWMNYSIITNFWNCTHFCIWLEKNAVLKLCTNIFFVLMQSLLDDESDRISKQRTGFKSALLADIRPSTDGRVQHGPSVWISSYILNFLFASAVDCLLYYSYCAKELSYGICLNSFKFSRFLFNNSMLSYVKFSNFVWYIFLCRRIRLHLAWHQR